ncbi:MULTISPECIES: S-layer homology domain-containing protein [Cohnella]|uniref:S-layer homology domain-containing protein n=1 Tax=Cohnella TaxID=329857 RepID=UPI001592D040|nr:MULTISPECIES: S-layer homology domain-containing protein [Cohnella]MBN2980689.1 S-layer homology domain-containing protein [Cohnella algarum]
MKKSLSLLLAIALVFGMFASMASAADSNLTTAQKYQQLKDNGVLKGTTTGSDMLNDNLTRAQFATIVIAVLGLSEDTSAPSPFTDVVSGQWWYGAIKAADNAGLVNGVGNGKFGPKQTVTLQEVYKVAATALGLEPVTDAKVDGAAAWAAPYIQALIDAGVTLPSTSYASNATRGQTIEVAFDLYQAGQVQPLSDVKAVVNSDDTITVTGKVDGNVDGVKVAVGSAAEAAATLNADKTFTYTSTKQSAGTYTVKVTAYAGTTAVKSEEVSVAIDGFAVESVTVLNGKQIAVKFNKAVQEGVSVGGHNYGVGAAATATSYFLIGGSGEPLRTSISDDKTTVTLTFADFTLNTYAQFSVSGSLKSASGKSLTAYKEAVYLSDTTAPTVSKVEYKAKKAVLTFSEPLTDVGTVSINGATISSSVSSSVYFSIGRDAENDITSIEVHNLDTDKNYSFYLIGGKDIAGNRFDYSTTLNVPGDSVAPTVTSVTVDGSTIKVKYSEEIGTAGAVYNTTYGGNVTGAIDSSDKTLVSYNVSGWLGGNSFLTVSVKISGYKDLVGNTGSDTTQTLTISKDTTAPTIESVFSDGNLIVLKFSESVANKPASLTYKYTSNSNVVTTNQTASLAGGTGGYDADNDGTVESGEANYVAYSVSSLPAGKYDISIPNGASFFADAAGNKTSATTVTLTVSGNTTSGIVTATIYTNGGTAGHNDATLANNQIKFVFSHSLTTAALDVSKFQINGVALPSGTNLYFLGNTKTVIAELPAGATPVSGDRLISVTNIVDENGNTLNTDNESNYKQVVFLNENVAPVAQSVAVISDRAIQVTFSEVLNTTVTASGVEVYINGTKYTGTTLSPSISGSALTLTAGTGNVFNNSQTIVVKFTGSNVADLKGNKVADSEISK